MDGLHVGFDLSADDPRTARWIDGTVRSALETLRDNVDDAELSQAFDDVGSGRRPLRYLLQQPGFGTLASRGLDDYHQMMAGATAEQRRAFEEAATQAGIEAGILARGERVELAIERPVCAEPPPD